MHSQDPGKQGLWQALAMRVKALTSTSKALALSCKTKTLVFILKL